MLLKLKKHINDNFSFLTEKKLLIAISGGIDSVVLTHLLHKLNYNITLAHCNFKLRETESDLDEEFVKKLGNKLHIKTFTTFFNTKEYAQKNKVSIQIAARELRYNWFTALVNQYNFDYILTAHHADDNIETFLINLIRGTGLKGLTGIPKHNKNIIRPLLIFSREQINEYAKNNNIKWREDASNQETKYIRNKLRNEVVPKLKEINPNLLNNFIKTTEHLKQDEQLIDNHISSVSKNIISYDEHITKFDIKKIKRLANPKAYLYKLLKEYNFSEWNNVYNLLTAQSGKFVTTKTHRLLKNRDFLLLSHISNSVGNENTVFLINENQSIDFPIKIDIEFTTLRKIDSKNAILVDKNLVNFPMILRKKKDGDVFFPKGMNGRKKISKYFKDEKKSLIEKENTWLLCTNNNEVIWIVGMRQDKRFSVNNTTKNILKISI